MEDVVATRTRPRIDNTTTAVVATAIIRLRGSIEAQRFRNGCKANLLELIGLLPGLASTMNRSVLTIG